MKKCREELIIVWWHFIQLHWILKLDKSFYLFKALLRRESMFFFSSIFFILSWRLYPEVDQKNCPRLIWPWFTCVKAAWKCVNFVPHYSNDNCSSPQFLPSSVPSMTSSYHLAKPSHRMFLVNKVIGNAVFFKFFVFFVRGRFGVEFRQE